MRLFDLIASFIANTLRVAFALIALCTVLAVMLCMSVVCKIQEMQLKHYLKNVEANAVLMPFPHIVTRIDYNMFWHRFTDWASQSDVKIIEIDATLRWHLPKSGRYVIVKSVPIGKVSPAFMLFLTKSDAVLYKLAFG